MSLIKVVLFYGTRPEAIKMLPVIAQLKKSQLIETYVVNTGQHRDLSLGIIEPFGYKPDFNFDVMETNQNLSSLTQKILNRTTELLAEIKPDIVLVHGDTTTAFAVSMASFYLKIPIGHVEAGLRTYDLDSPFPEEMNRTFTDKVSKYCFAPTSLNKKNLIKESILEENIFITGNTVIDAAQMMLDLLEKKKFEPQVLSKFSIETQTKIKNGDFLLITAHRRESFGAPMRSIAQGLKLIAQAQPELILLYPVHPNPNVHEVMNEELKDIPNIKLISPLDYESLIWFLSRCKIVITDSGGLQEESTAFRKRCIILREVTERPEVLENGWGVLVGTDAQKIRDVTLELINSSEHNSLAPFGDGTAAQKIVHYIEKQCSF